MQNTNTNVGYSYETEKAMPAANRYAAYGKALKEQLALADAKAKASERKDGANNE